MDRDFLSNLLSLEGRVIVLTGGAGFLGEQYMEALVRAGAHVVSLDHAEPTSPAAIQSARTYLQVDITDEDQVRRAVAKVFEQFGRIDALVNNAAMNPAVGDPSSAKMSLPYEKHPIDLWRKELEVNVTGMQICIQAVVPYMMKAKRGSIVNVASEVSVIAYDWTGVYEPGKFKSLAYITSKFAVIGLTKGWAAYLGRHGVRVNAFSPGGVERENMPSEFVERYSRKNMLGSMAQVGDYNSHIVFLCSDASARMTGHNLLADGGKSAW